jgi:hypothetical protein
MSRHDNKFAQSLLDKQLWSRENCIGEYITLRTACEFGWEQIKVVWVRFQTMQLAGAKMAEGSQVGTVGIWETEAPVGTQTGMACTIMGSVLSNRGLLRICFERFL